MVFLILTRKGFIDLKPDIKNPKNYYWVSEGILSDTEAQNHWDEKVNLTIVEGKIDPRDENKIEGILVEIEEHHPGETVWIERRTAL